jgi:hypothetical protein
MIGLRKNSMSWYMAHKAYNFPIACLSLKRTPKNSGRGLLALAQAQWGGWG